MVIVMNERCVYELQASSSLSVPTNRPFPSATFTFDIWYCLIAFRALICLFLPVPSESTRAECVNVDSVQPNGMLKIGTSKCIVGSFVLSVRLFTFGLWGRWTKHKHIWARLLLSVFIIESIFLSFFALFFIHFHFMLLSTLYFSSRQYCYGCYFLPQFVMSQAIFSLRHARLQTLQFADSN